MKEFAINAAINQLSFGDVSVNILQEMHLLGLNPCVFPIGNVDLSSFEGICSNEFIQWLQKNINKSITAHKRTNPTIKIWHINSSIESFSEKQFLYTFFELDALTSAEINTLRNQEHIFVSNTFTQKVFDIYGIDRVTVAPLGFDSRSFKKLDKAAYDDPSIITMGIVGKWEARKNTERAIKAWARKFGGKASYRLHLQVNNPFLGQNPEQNAALNAQLLNQALEGKKYFNIQAYPYFRTRKELNQLYNSVDGVIDCSSGEAWSLPSFSMVALGKHGLVFKNTGIEEWANNENCVTLPITGKRPAYDGLFFHQGSPYNQGNVFEFENADLDKGLDLLEERIKKTRLNEEGLKLQEKFTWQKTTQAILDKINE